MGNHHDERGGLQWRPNTVDISNLLDLSERRRLPRHERQQRHPRQRHQRQARFDLMNSNLVTTSTLTLTASENYSAGR